MRKRKQYIKTALCLLLSAGLICSDMPSTALAAEEKLETEIMTEIQETEQQTEEMQRETNVGNNADMESTMVEGSVEETTSVGKTETQTAEPGQAETQTAEPGQAETQTAETEASSSEEERPAEKDTEEQTGTTTSETITETETVSDKETETVEKTETVTENTTETETETEMESVTEETETVTENMTETETETETETATEEVKVNEAENRLAFSDTDIAHGEYKEDGNDITWVIDENGKLTVEGTGDFAEPFDEEKLDNSLKRAPWYSKRDAITTAVINVKGMKDSSAMFYKCKNLSDVDFSSFDTSSVTNMEYMFCACDGLTELDLSSFNTSKVTSMRAMFSERSDYDFLLQGRYHEGLEKLDLSSFDTSSVTDMRGMFYGCGSLEELNLSSFDTSSVTDMSYMFRAMLPAMGSDKQYSLKLDLGNFNTENVTNMSYMFYGSRNLTELNLNNFNTENVTDMSWMFSSVQATELDVSSFDTGNVTTMEGMFCGCEKLISLDLKNFDTGNVTRMDRMFERDESLTNLELGSFDMGNVENVSRMFNICESLKSVDFSKVNTRNMTNMFEMFSGWSGVTELDLSSFNTSNVIDMSNMFLGCTSLSSLNLRSFDTSKVTDMSGMFFGCSSLPELDLRSFDTSKVTDMGGMFNDCSSLPELDLRSFDTSNVMSMGAMFGGCSSLPKLGLSSFDTSNVTNMSFMFSGCSNLPELDLRSFDTSKVLDMSGMFKDCSSLPKLDLRSFDTSKVRDMEQMFYGCSNLPKLDLSNFDTGNVSATYGMSSMFSGCSSLSDLDLSSFDTSKVLDMGSMFSGCSSLPSLDLNSFDTGKVVGMDRMFKDCSSLPSLDLRNFDTSNVTRMTSMFEGCSSLTSIDLSSFDAGNVKGTSGVIADVFSNCTSLIQLYTPRNLKETVNLDDTWYDINGTSYIALPKEQADSILLYKKISSPDGTGRIFAKKETTTFLCGDTLTVDDLTVTYYDKDGKAKTLDQADYTTNAAQIAMNTAGEKTLTVTYQPAGGNVLTTDLKLMIKNSFDATRVTVTLPDADSYSYIYDGNGKKPEPTVTYTVDGEAVPLVKKTDYMLSYQNNVNAYKDSADTAENAPTVIITGRGIYSGKVTKTFEIEKASAPENEELTKEYTYFSRPQNAYIYFGDCFKGYKKVSCTVGTPVENDEISGSVLFGTPTVNDGMTQLICSLNAGTAGDFVTIPVTFSFDNYEDAVLNVKIIFTGTPGAEKKKVKISGIEIKDSTYNKTPASYTGTAKVISETDSTDVTGTVKLTYTYSGTQADNSAYTDTPNAPANAGSYKLTIAVSPDNKDYTGSVEYPFKITKAPLTITARDMGLKIGAPLPKQEDYLYDAAGLLTGDALTTAPALSCSITDTAKAGTYDIIASNADAGMNYEITYKNGTLTVSETGESTKYYTVTYNMNGHGNDITNTGVKEGSLLEKPQDPQAEGYTFTGWYKDQSCTVLWDFAKDTIQSDTTVYAGWKANDDNKDDNNDQYPADKDDSAFTDAERTPLSAVSAAIANIRARVYDGTAYEPTIRVTANINGKNTTLTEGIDYRVLYKDHIKAGTATVTIKGNGIYKGSISKTYTISPRPVKKLKVITGSVAVAQTGADTASLPVYVYDGAKRLSYNTDFTLTGYSAAGQTAQVTVTGKGNYTGSMTAKLSLYNVASDKLINPGNVGEIQPMSYNAGKAVKPEPVVTAGGARLVKNKDYKVQYQNNKNAGTAFAIVTGKGAYRGKVVVPFTIKAAQGTSGMTVKSISAKTYNGKYQRPAPSVTVSIGGRNKKLVKNKDYTVTYKNNRHAGTAEVLITGKGNYAGMTAKTTFTIKPRNITKASLKGTQGNLTLTYSKGILKQGADYEQPVYGEVKKNKIKVTIKGKGDFTGTMQKSVKLQ